MSVVKFSFCSPSEIYNVIREKFHSFVSVTFFVWPLTYQKFERLELPSTQINLKLEETTAVETTSRVNQLINLFFHWWVMQIYEIYKIFLNLRSSSFLISIRNLSFESLVAAFILTAAICMDSEIGILKHINFHDFKIRMTELLIHNSSIARSNLYGSTNLPL